MTLLYVVSICVWTSVTLATQDQTMFTTEALAANPLVQSLQERMDMLEKKVLKVDMLEKKVLKQEEDIQTLKADMAEQRGDMMKMRSKLNVKDKTIQLLLQKLTKSDDNEKSDHANTQTAYSPDVTGEMRQTRNDANRIRRAQNEVTVAFSSGLSKHMLQVGDHQNIKFDQVITNVGNAYNPHQGVFVAPVPGVYVFSTSILSYDSRNNWAYLVVNGVQKSQLFMHDDSHAMSSQTMVFELNKGDDVAVQGHTNDAYFGIAGLPYTTFTGFLLQQNYTDVGNVIG